MEEAIRDDSEIGNREELNNKNGFNRNNNQLLHISTKLCSSENMSSIGLISNRTTNIVNDDDLTPKEGGRSLLLSNNQQKETSSAEKQQQEASGYASGRWTTEEHEIFISCLQQYGREWKKIAYKVPTRTPAQIRSHAQKYLSKLSKQKECKEGLYKNVPNAGVVIVAKKTKQCKISATTLEKIEQIKNNPSAVEDEVKSTLESLCKMYDHLLNTLVHTQQSSSKNILKQNNHKNKPRPYKKVLFNNATHNKKTEHDNGIGTQNKHRELHGHKELIAIQVLCTCLNTTTTTNNSKNVNNNNSNNDTTSTSTIRKRKRTYNEYFDRL